MEKSESINAGLSLWMTSTQNLITKSYAMLHFLRPVMLSVKLYMYIPEIPWLQLTFKARCPSCKETIGGHIVQSRFRCPFCEAILNSNKKETTKRAVVIGVVLYIVLFFVINFVSMSTWPQVAAVIAGSLAPILVGIGYFKINIKVVNEKKAL